MTLVPTTHQPKRCAIYTRKSTEAGLDSQVNSLVSQREICQAYIRSQAHRNWIEARMDRSSKRVRGRGNTCSPRRHEASGSRRHGGGHDMATAALAAASGKGILAKATSRSRLH